MARSSNIYVLTNQGGAEPSHAFTVKHELVSFMNRYAEGLPGRNVFRLPDGRQDCIHSWPAEQYLAENG